MTKIVLGNVSFSGEVPNTHEKKNLLEKIDTYVQNAYDKKLYICLSSPSIHLGEIIQKSFPNGFLCWNGKDLVVLTNDTQYSNIDSDYYPSHAHQGGEKSILIQTSTGTKISIHNSPDKKIKQLQHSIDQNSPDIMIRKATTKSILSLFSSKNQELLEAYLTQEGYSLPKGFPNNINSKPKKYSWNRENNQTQIYSKEPNTISNIRYDPSILLEGDRKTLVVSLKE